VSETAQPQPRTVTVAQVIDGALRFKAQGKTAEAEALLRRALQAQPNNLRALRGLAELLGQTRRPGQALACWDALLKLAPADAEALQERGMVLMNMSRPRDALAAFETALAASPDFIPALHNRAVALSMLGRHAEALKAYERTLELDPEHASAWNNRGVALQEMRRPDAALESFDKALALKAEYGAALGNRGAALRELGRHAEALASCEAALALNADDLSALNNKGAALHELHRLKESETVYRRVLELQPNHVTTLNNLGNVLGELNRADEAMAAYDRAIELSPKAASTYDNKGLLLNELGRHDEAAAVIEQSIRIAPRRVRGYYNLSSARKFAPGEPLLAAMQALAAEPADLTLTDRIEIAYALAKAHADLGEHDRAFDRYLEGAALKKQQMGYDEPLELGLLERTSEAFTAEAMWRGQGVGDPSDVPVFILGMPRSGTTLVEQILASHPQVFAAGEIEAFLSGMIDCAARRKMADTPEAFAGLPDEGLKALGEDYLARTRPMAPGSARIVDKSLQSFRFAGLIHLALPEARFISVKRNPMDACLSCFTKLFVSELPYTYDLGELGRYFKGYEKLTNHWKKVMPKGVLIEVQYEDVVDDLETQARRIVAHAGLDWDPACLDFHTTDRPVRTASLMQVRQPIYTSAVNRWKTYEKHLVPLQQSLGLA
jgi:tetratricopeptide (TPR) repeat protein